MIVPVFRVENNTSLEHNELTRVLELKLESQQGLGLDIIINSIKQSLIISDVILSYSLSQLQLQLQPPLPLSLSQPLSETTSILSSDSKEIIPITTIINNESNLLLLQLIEIFHMIRPHILYYHNIHLDGFFIDFIDTNTRNINPRIFLDNTIICF